MAEIETQQAADGAVRDRVIHIADIHFWRMVWNPRHLLSKRFFGNLTVWLRRRHEFIIENAEPHADAVAATGASAAILTGDFCSTATPEEFEMAVRFVRGLRERGLRVYVLPGNHDVYTFGAARAERFERHLREFLPPEGYPSLAILPGGTPLILAPTVRPRRFSARGYIAPAKAAAVAKLLENCTDTVLAAGHYPVLHKTHGYVSNRFRQLENAELLRRALGESGRRILYLGGHVHRFSYQCDVDYPRLYHVTTGAFFRRHAALGTHGEFTEICVRETSYEIIRHVRRAQWEVERPAPREGA